MDSKRYPQRTTVLLGSLILLLGLGAALSQALTPTANAQSPADGAAASVGGLDYGDAPDSYATLIGSGGPAHGTGSPFFLGAFVDPEPDGQPTPFADGDDLDTFFPSGGDDEDGVISVTPLAPGAVATATVAAGPAGGLLDAWIDYNGNGVFDDPAERITIASGAPLAPGINTLTFTVPPGAVPGPTFSRLRISSFGGLLPGGFSPDGEVEDYPAVIQSPTSVELRSYAAGEGAPPGGRGFLYVLILCISLITFTSVTYGRTRSAASRL